MPIYEYKCEDCEHIEEVLQKSTEGFYFLGKGCPNCGSSGTMSRMLSMGSFHLKGSGWYKDGYGDKRSVSKEEKIERTTTKTTSTNTKTGENKVVSEKPLDPKTPVARSLVDD